MFKITNDWLMQHRTKKGGWTKRQFEILWLKWPMKKGWKKFVIGQHLTCDQQIAFEQAAITECKTKKPDNLTIDKCLAHLNKHFKDLNLKHYDSLLQLVEDVATNIDDESPF